MVYRYSESEQKLRLLQTCQQFSLPLFSFTVMIACVRSVFWLVMGKSQNYRLPHLCCNASQETEDVAFGVDAA